MAHVKNMEPHQLLEWYRDAGVDEATDDTPVNYFKAREPAAHTPENIKPPTPSPQQEAPSLPASPPKLAATPLHHSPSAAAATARTMADKASTLEELEAAIRDFDGCALKKTASKTVFCDGNPQAKIMIIGEAPGAQEDIQGIPFCGPSGKLLDAMLASISLSRQSVYISNTVFWRPPGNRQPTPEETAICLPFVEKHIALVNPTLLILSGGTAATTLLRKDATISRLRGKFYDYSNPYLQAAIPAAITFHPSYLLRTPQQKRHAWEDFLMIQAFLSPSTS